MRCKELRAQVDVLAGVPIFHRRVRDRLACIIGGIVHQPRDRPVGLRRSLHRVLQRCNIRDVTPQEQRIVFIPARHFSHKITGIGPLNKCHLGPLLKEPFGQRRANARPAASDEHRGVRKVMESRKRCHLWSFHRALVTDQSSVLPSG